MKKKSNVLFLFFIFALTFLFSSCSDDDNDNTKELILERSDVSLIQGKSIVVNIESGNGEYTAVSSNDNVAIASISGNTITITSTTTEDRANAAIIITDKKFKRSVINVKVAKVFDLILDNNYALLEVGVKDKSEITIFIKEGNFGYNIELLDNSNQLIETDITDLESEGKFYIKAITEGLAKIKVTDSMGKEATVELSISTPSILTIDEKSLILSAAQGSDVVNVITGNGNYKVTFSNSLVAKADIDGDIITVTGKMNGTTSFVIEDEKGQKSDPIEVVVEGPQYAMNLGTSYFCYANFVEIAAVDKSIKECKQVTFELTCKMDGYRGLQTFMGLEGKLIFRGKYDDYKETHPIEIAGLGDRIMLLSTSSFNLNEWFNIALVVDCEQESIENKYKLYINGVQDKLIINRQDETHTVVDLASSSDGNRFEIGRAAGQDWRAMQGTVSEARVWTVARTAQQIKNNMCTLTEVNPEGLLARWDFTAGVATNYIQDISGGKYESNLVIASISGDYSAVTVPTTVFVEKGCPK